MTPFKKKKQQTTYHMLSIDSNDKGLLENQGILMIKGCWKIRGSMFLIKNPF